MKDAAVTDPRVHLGYLTGSTEVGIGTAQLAAANLTHTALELGGNDAFIVLDDGDVDLAVKKNGGVVGVLTAIPVSMLQQASVFLIHNSLKDEFTKKVIDCISNSSRSAIRKKRIRKSAA